MAALCLLLSMCLLATVCGQYSENDQNILTFLNSYSKKVGGSTSSGNNVHQEECPCPCTMDQNTAGEGRFKLRMAQACTSSQQCCHSTTPAGTGRQFTQDDLTTIPPVTAFPSGSTVQNFGCGKTQQKLVMLRANFADEDGNIVETLEEEFPWTVAVYRNSKFLCGGSLIHPRAVLTAAHSFRRVNKHQLFIRAGEHDRVQHNQMFEYQESTVMEIVRHNDYDQVLKCNDAAILFLHKDILPGDNVAYVCLPPPTLQPTPRTVCIATGWGATRVGGSMQTRKKMVELPLVDHNTCETSIRKTPRIRSTYQLSDTMLCAGGEGGPDVCTGDGGAPLVCAYTGESERYYQAGITSWGIGCGLVNKPGVFTAVHRVRGWIDTTMAARGLDASYYTPHPTLINY